VATESESGSRDPAASPEPERDILLYLDTSAVLRAVLETGTSPPVEERIRSARLLVTSRLSLVESCRAFLGLRALGEIPEQRLADAERDVEAIWSRCELWEITPTVCETACAVATARPLRALDAIHLATFVVARRRLGDLEFLSTDTRLLDAALGVR
jgi:predicted nucleic acid-binding protein